jgi:hypothetical protein
MYWFNSESLNLLTMESIFPIQYLFYFNSFYQFRNKVSSNFTNIRFLSESKTGFYWQFRGFVILNILNILAFQYLQDFNYWNKYLVHLKLIGILQFNSSITYSLLIILYLMFSCFMIVFLTSGGNMKVLNECLVVSVQIVWFFNDILTS